MSYHLWILCGFFSLPLPKAQSNIKAKPMHLWTWPLPQFLWSHYFHYGIVKRDVRICFFCTKPPPMESRNATGAVFCLLISLLFSNLLCPFLQGCFASFADKFLFLYYESFQFGLVTANVTKRTVMIPVLIKYVLKLCTSLRAESFIWHLKMCFSGINSSHC